MALAASPSPLTVHITAHVYELPAQIFPNSSFCGHFHAVGALDSASPQWDDRQQQNSKQAAATTAAAATAAAAVAAHLMAWHNIANKMLQTAPAPRALVLQYD